MITPFYVCGLAFGATLAATPLIRLLARRLDIVDHPDEHRKLHTQPTPLGGGIAVFFGLIVAGGALFLAPRGEYASFMGSPRFLISLVLALAMICVVGLIDDRWTLRGRQKLFGQFLAVCILLAGGLIIEKVQIFSWGIELGLLAVPFTLFWLMGAINALNLIDGIDGLATGVGLVLSLALTVMALMTGHYSDAVLALALAGALAAFLVYNMPPASIFLGDAGSMLIGLALGALAIRSSLKGPATIALAAPTAIWAIPIFDVSMAILRRKLTGRSIYTSDRGHLHHSLLRRGWGGNRSVAVIGILCCLTASAALLSVYQNNELLAVGGVLAVVGTLIVSRFFGHHEFLLLCRRAKTFGLSFVSPPRLDDHKTDEVCTRFQGDRQWDEVWSALIDFAEKYDLKAVQLNVELPLFEEEYHATWKCKNRPSESHVWRMELPIVVDEMIVGRLKLMGVHHSGSFCELMEDLAQGLEPFEERIGALLKDELFQMSPSSNTSNRMAVVHG